jgi:hypothetical protein
MHHNFGYALFLGTLQNRVGERAFQQAGQYGNDIETHGAKITIYECADVLILDVLIGGSGCFQHLILFYSFILHPIKHNQENELHGDNTAEERIEIVPAVNQPVGNDE